MKVAFISRATLYTSAGGDTRQIDMTAHYLRQMGISVDICLTNHEINYQQYDLLHFFNIIRPADIIYHIKKSGKPYVVSTIFVEYSAYEKSGRAAQLLHKIFNEDQVEYIKAIARWLKNGEKINSRHYLVWGHAKAIKYVAEHAAMLLPNSESEYQRFEQRYHTSSAYHVVPNGIDEQLTMAAVNKNDKYENSVLCVARIEGRKNQLNLIRALNNTEYKLFIIGKPSPNNMAYYEQCRKEAAANIHFCGWVDDVLPEIYAAAKVHVLSSYFETTGLSSLEAAVMGCNIVITDKGDTREYFGKHAWYCEPGNPASIKASVDAAYTAPYDNGFRQYILSHYTWKKAAEETLHAYKQILIK